jgi:hypothetical protein
VAETLLLAVERSGENFGPYAEKLIPILLSTATDPSNATLRSSALSIIGTITENLKFGIHPYVPDIGFSLSFIFLSRTYSWYIAFSTFYIFFFIFLPLFSNANFMIVGVTTQALLTERDSEVKRAAIFLFTQFFTTFGMEMFTVFEMDVRRIYRILKIFQSDLDPVTQFHANAAIGVLVTMAKDYVTPENDPYSFLRIV